VSPASGARAQQNPHSLITPLPGEQFGRETAENEKSELQPSSSGGFGPDYALRHRGKLLCVGANGARLTAASIKDEHLQLIYAHNHQVKTKLLCYFKEVVALIKTKLVFKHLRLKT
jgi:hypothetical protein